MGERWRTVDLLSLLCDCFGVRGNDGDSAARVLPSNVQLSKRAAGPGPLVRLGLFTFHRPSDVLLARKNFTLFYLPL
jgi:hypothetical protein